MIKYLLIYVLFLGTIHAQGQSSVTDGSDDSMFNSMKKYSYLLIEYPKQTTETDKDKGAIATGFFIRQKGKLFLITNYHVITGVDGWSGRFQDQYDSIKLRYFDKYGETCYYTMRLDEINKNSKIVSFLEYPDIYVLEITDMPKAAKIFSIEKFISGEREGKFEKEKAFSFQYSLTPNNTLEQQMKDIKALDQLQASAHEFNTTIIEGFGVAQGMPNNGGRLNPDSVNMLMGDQGFAVGASTVIQAGWPQGLLANSGHSLTGLSGGAQPIFVGANISIPATWLQSGTVGSDSAITLAGRQPIAFGLNVADQASWSQGLAVNQDHSLSRIKEVGQPLFGGSSISLPAAWLQNSSMNLDSIATINGWQPIALGGITANQAGWPLGLTLNPDHSLSGISENGQSLFVGSNISIPASWLHGSDMNLDSIATINGWQPIALVGCSTNLAGWQKGSTPYPDHSLSGIPEIGKPLFGASPSSMPATWLQGSIVSLDSAATLGGMQPIGFGGSTANQLIWVQGLFANPEQNNTGLAGAGVPIFGEANASVPATWLQGISVNLDSMATFQGSQIQILATQNSPANFFTNNNLQIGGQMSQEVIINPFSLGNAVRRPVHLSLNDRLNFDNYPSTLYIGVTVEPSFYKFYPPSFDSLNFLLNPKTFFGASGSPVFFKCTGIRNNKKIEWIEFAGVQSSITETLDLSIIVKAREIISKINQAK